MSRPVQFFSVTTVAVVLVGLSMSAPFATAQKQGSNDENPLDGKAVVFESEAASLARTPRQNVRVERIAGREFFVWERKVEGEKTHDYWTPADKILKIRVFSRLEDAEAFCQQRISGS